MSHSVTMNDREHVSASFKLRDEDGQPFTSLPPGATVEFDSSDPEVAEFTPDATGLSGDIASGKVGTAVITGRARLEDGAEFVDTLTVTVSNSRPLTADFVAGTPVPEE